MRQIRFELSDEQYDFLDGISDDTPNVYVKKGVLSAIENKQHPIPDSAELLRRLLELYPTLKSGTRGFDYLTLDHLYKIYFEKYGSTKLVFKKALEKLLDSNHIHNSKGEWILTLSKGTYTSENDIKTKYDTWKYVSMHPDKYDGKLSWK